LTGRIFAANKLNLFARNFLTEFTLQKLAAGVTRDRFITEPNL